MLTPKQRTSLVRLVLSSIGLWAISTFPVMILYNAKGGLAMPTTQTVSISLYQSAVDFSHVLIYKVIPGITLGYLVIGFYIFKFLVNAKKEEKHNV
jgi:hypothetical protein